MANTAERVLYVVAREQSMLVGYLRTRAGAGADRGGLVEVKLDERRGERRLSREARAPERRRRERRVRPSLEAELLARGYAVVPSETGPSLADEPAPERVIVWRPRSSWRQRVARASRRRWAWWGSMVVLLAAIGLSILVARSGHWVSAPGPPAPPPAAPERAPEAPPQSAPSVAPPTVPPVEEASPPPPTARRKTVAPSEPPPPAPPRLVSTRTSGVVASVDPQARLLVLEERGAGGVAGRLRVPLAPDARVVLSERDEQAEDLSHPFKDTAITLAEVRRGDYVVVEMRGPEGKELGRSVVVTFRSP